MKVKLTARDGKLVAFVEILKMSPVPDVVVWGARTFSSTHTTTLVELEPVPVYIETVIAVSHTEAPGI